MPSPDPSIPTSSTGQFKSVVSFIPRKNVMQNGASSCWSLSSYTVSLRECRYYRLMQFHHVYDTIDFLLWSWGSLPLNSFRLPKRILDHMKSHVAGNSFVVLSSLELVPMCLGHITNTAPLGIYPSDQCICLKKIVYILNMKLSGKENCKKAAKQILVINF